MHNLNQCISNIFLLISYFVLLFRVQFGESKPTAATELSLLRLLTWARHLVWPLIG